MDRTFQHCHASHTVLTQSYVLDDVLFTADLHKTCTNPLLQAAQATNLYGVA